MSKKEYSKTLKRHEAKYRYWSILKADRDFFPDEGVEFKVEFEGKTWILKVNNKNDVMTSQFYEKYKFLENDRISLKKKKEDFYTMEAPDTKPYPNING